jgi:ElaB/YqjD/DUF883 family membrane-anchored ribosome-binding protein
MNIETKASHDALVSAQGDAAGPQARSYDDSKEKLQADLKVLVADAQQLLREVANSSAAGFTSLRTRFEERVRDATASIDSKRAAIVEKGRLATDAAHAYVKENPWQAVGICAAAVALIGLLLGGRRR